MAEREGAVLPPNEEARQKSNKNPNAGPNSGPNQNPPPPPNPFLPNTPMAPAAAPRPQLNWSHFKPEYAGKPEEDAELHLLRMNDWMDTHNCQDKVKVQRFCLTLVGEARLWYKSLRPINVDWVGLQNIF